jgi:3'-phosphoadenosine 5'-phosphosulfate sulfotransferase (PAPS reductase)/FAD synthetase
MKQVIALSGGKDSTAMAIRLRELNPNVDYHLLISPTGNELPEMREHWSRLECLLGKPMIRLLPFGEGVDGLLRLIEQWGALPNHRQRWCTRVLKIEPAIAWMVANAPCVQYVGLRADEDADERRGIYGEIPGVEQRFPLREWGWGVDDVWGYLAERGVKIPKRTDCGFCYAQRLIEWKRLWEQHPEMYEQAVQLEKATGHTFRSPSRDTWPAPLDELRAEFEAGRRVKGEKRPGMIQLDLWDVGEPEQQSCRVCRM